MLTTQQKSTFIQTMIDGWGGLKSITFKENGIGGGDVYQVDFDRGSSCWTPDPLQGGKITAMAQPAFQRTNKGPSPGVQDAVRRYYEGLLKKEPAYEIMNVQLIAAIPSQLADLEKDAQNLGAEDADLHQDQCGRLGCLCRHI